jgi:hypothetical protein
MVEMTLGLPKGDWFYPWERSDLSAAQWTLYKDPQGLKNGDFVHSILKLGEIHRAMEGTVPFNLRFVLRNKSLDYYCMTLRRLLDRISNSKSWRGEIVRPATANVPRTQRKLGLSDRIYDANNRFNVLLSDIFDEDVESSEYPWVDAQDAIVDPFTGPDKEDVQYYRTAQVNATRKKMGYAPKSIKAFNHPPSVERPEFKKVESHMLRHDARHKCLDIFRRLKEWRRAHSKTIRDGGVITDITPIALIEPYERFAAEYEKLGGEAHPLGASLIPDLIEEWGLADDQTHDLTN